MKNTEKRNRKDFATGKNYIIMKEYEHKRFEVR